MKQYVIALLLCIVCVASGKAITLADKTYVVKYTVSIEGAPIGTIPELIAGNETAKDGETIALPGSVKQKHLKATKIGGYNAAITMNKKAISVVYTIDETAIFNPSPKYIRHWVRLVNVSDSHALSAHKGVDELQSRPTDITTDDQLFALVGSAKCFTIYNKATGEYIPFGYERATKGSAVKLAEKKSSKTFAFVFNGDSEHPGYNIVPTGIRTQSLNSVQGNDVKLADIAAEGSTWAVSLCNATANLVTTIEGAPTHLTNNRAGTMTVRLGGSTSTTTAIYNPDEASHTTTRTMYLNSLSPITVSVDTPWRGYTVTLTDNQGNEGEELTYSELPADLTVTATFTPKETHYQYLWYNGTPPNRIPALATRKDGRLLAICDFRPCGGDIGNGRVDLVQRIGSSDGEVWKDERTIIKGNVSDASTANDGYGDPAICVDRESGKVLLLCVTGHTICGQASRSNPNRIARLYSEDGGETFHALNQSLAGSCDDITEDIYKLWDKEDGTVDEYTAQSLFVGSGRICQSRRFKATGAKYNRIYAALWSRDMHNRVAYSDDFGETWHALGGRTDVPFPDFNDANEPKCEELPNGDVVISSRKPNGRYFNIFRYTNRDTGEGAWATAAESDMAVNGDNNGTNGEIMIIDVKDTEMHTMTIALQTLPLGGGAVGRSNVGFFYKNLSSDLDYQLDGQSEPSVFAKQWEKGIVFGSAEGSAYSTFTIQDDGKIGVFYEEAPGGYNMVYLPLTLTQITNGEYARILTAAHY